MPILKVVILAIVQGLAELLPVSSSAHVVVAAKLMHMRPMSSPDMTLLLVMLHTGTMFAVIAYFWKRWAHAYFRSRDTFMEAAVRIVVATVLTAVVGFPLQKIVAKVMLPGAAHAEIEQLFDRLDLIAAALFCVGLLILFAGLAERRSMTGKRLDDDADMGLTQAGIIGATQGLALPFRGFSRSGSTISAGMLAGVNREQAEVFSFALAVVLTPAVLGREILRLLKATHEAAAGGTPIDLHSVLGSSVLGLFLAFLAGLAGLKWLSSWLESGKWYLFGIYCLLASVVVFVLHTRGY